MPTHNTLQDIARALVSVDDDIAEAKDRLKDMQASKRQLISALLERMIEDGAPSVEIIREDGSTARVSPVTKLYASRVPESDDEVFANAMREAGWGHLVRTAVNSNSLSAVVREFCADHELEGAEGRRIAEALPCGLAGLVKVSTDPSVAIRRKR